MTTNASRMPVTAIFARASALLQLCAGQLMPTLERALEHFPASAQKGRVQLQLPVSTSRSARSTRGPLSAIIQRRSAGVTKCHVGRRMCVRRIAPSLNACSTEAHRSSDRALAERPFRARVVL